MLPIRINDYQKYLVNPQKDNISLVKFLLQNCTYEEILRLNC